MRTGWLRVFLVISLPFLSGCLPGSSDSSTTVPKKAPEQKLAEGAEQYNQMGLRACERQAYHKAVSYFEQAIRMRPKEAIYYNNLGRAWYWLGEYKYAMQMLEKAAALDGKNPSVRANIGDVYRQKKDYVEAARQYHLALEIDKTFARAHYELGNMYLKRSELDKAEYRLNRALMLDPGFNKALLARAILLHLQHRDLDAWRDVKALERRGFEVRSDLKRAILDAVDQQKAKRRFQPAH